METYKLGNNRLRMVRVEQRISQLMLGLMTGINSTRIWKIENGYTIPTQHERENIVRQLGVGDAAIWPV